MHSHVFKFASAAAAAALTLSLGACASYSTAETTTDGSSAEAETGTWPRTVTDDAGNEVEIPAKPERIVSTTVSTTGSLLALDAPLVGSATAAISPQSDENGWFTQWADVAVERDLEPIYQLGNFDLEAVVAQDPDLIVVSTSGADSEIDNLAQLQDIAPTYVVNYGDKDWKELTEELGEATGTEANAAAVIDEFDQRAESIKQKLAIPAGTTASIVSYNQGDDSPVGKTTGPHAALISSLGFDIVEPPAEYDTSTQVREDFAFTSYEGLAESATGDAVFLISATDEIAKAFKDDATLANLPSVKNDNVFPLANSFRLDYYSSSGILDYFENDFPGLNEAK
ncbi:MULTISPECIES: Fe2+-enterobactin ABC transporter substrate-binding protein [Glutamicibacter]|uniref:Iron-siderophore ABC transporter, substrate-binding protein n=1 Tax=Glutamicibacter arilaitensis (strain DSM 16368 / CIP 108037 / IAM 15318 / JCM 13566 / NCIMB 14258 / Re117) TaxID=861360 RepID=A0ABM9PTI8_GLUAR|nr:MULTISPECIES: Fe2+-enterobactin ABC transporter substrate-binding protein [Glutamicibacter]CBT74523.1 iron-siderophore ABC transporter, substrate-binding protein [Glutamicibacter arilaitensis Re117]